MKKSIVLMTLFLVACAPPQPARDVDQCMRNEIFKACLGAVPEGPKSVVYNDWAEVVDECQSSAYYQSIRNASQVSPACSAGGI